MRLDFGAYLLKRTLETRWAISSMIPLFATMVSALQHLSAYQITLVESRIVSSVIKGTLLLLAFRITRE